jgi:hypothetical protein
MAQQSSLSCVSMRVVAGAIACLCTLATAPVQGAELEMKVTATVRKHASLRVLAQPGAVTVTPSDIARGYVEVVAPMQVAVRSNTQEGYMLVFDSHGDFFRQARVRGLGSEVQMGAGGGHVAQRASGGGMNTATLALAFRFELSQSAKEGIYAWPVHLSVMPL